jgi:hypothetical protein
LGEGISHQVLDYFQVNDLASNQIILLNILYARDGAPLHFSELSQVRGQLSASASASTTFPFSAINHATMAPRDLATIGASVSSAPSFDIASLDTKDFTAGVMAPITPQTVKFFLDEGVDYRIVLMLFFSGVRRAGTSEMVLNAPDDSRVLCTVTPHSFGSNSEVTDYRIIGANEACAKSNEISEFLAYLDTINHISRVYPVSVRTPAKPVGPPFSLAMSSNLRAITGIDPAKYKLVRLPSGQYQMMTVPHNSMVVLCQENGASGQVLTVLSDADDAQLRVREDACSTRQSSDDDGTGNMSPPGKMITIGQTTGTYALELRSTLEVIRYVGQVQAYQEAETERHPTRPERCVTLQYIPYDASHATCSGDVLIHLLRNEPPIFSSDVSVMYNGDRWSLPPPRNCEGQQSCDLSQETLSIISLLLNQNKSAKDLTSTPAVEVVP